MSFYTIDVRVPGKKEDAIYSFFESGKNGEFEILSSDILYSDLNSLYCRLEIFSTIYDLDQIQKIIKLKIPFAHFNVKEDLTLYENSMFEMIPKSSLEYTKSFMATSPAAVENAQEHLLPQRSCLSSLNLTQNRMGVISDGMALDKPYQILFQLERDVYLISKHAKIQAFPLFLETQNEEQLIRTIKNLSSNFFALRLSGLNRNYAMEVSERLLEECNIPIIHAEYDETATIIASILVNAAGTYGMELKNKTAAIIGLDPVGHGLLELLFALGLSKVYGIDPDARQLTRFEKNNGIATSLEKVYSKADFVIITPRITVRLNEKKFSPEQIILSFSSNALRINHFESPASNRVYQGHSPHPVFVLPGVAGALHQNKGKKINLDFKLKLINSLRVDKNLQQFLPIPTDDLFKNQIALVSA